MASLENILRRGVREQPDVGALAALDGNTLSIMVWHYHDDDVPAPAATIQVEVKSIPAKKVQVTHYRIDSSNSNSYEVWKSIGRPAHPTEAQYRQLEQSGMLQQLGKAQWEGR